MPQRVLADALDLQVLAAERSASRSTTCRRSRSTISAHTSFPSPRPNVDAREARRCSHHRDRALQSAQDRVVAHRQGQCCDEGGHLGDLFEHLVVDLCYVPLQCGKTLDGLGAMSRSGCLGRGPLDKLMPPVGIDQPFKIMN